MVLKKVVGTMNITFLNMLTVFVESSLSTAKLSCLSTPCVMAGVSASKFEICIHKHAVRTVHMNEIVEIVSGIFLDEQNEAI